MVSAAARPTAKARARVATAARSVVVPPLLVIAFVLVEWLAFDVSFRDAILFIGYQLGYIVVPGVLLYIMISGRVALGLEQIAFGWAVGYALELGLFSATAAAGLRSLLAFYPLVVGAAGAVYLIAKVRARAFEPVRLEARPWVWAAAVLQIVLVAYMGDLMFAVTPPPTTGLVSYYQDQVWFMSLAAEARHHWPLQLPNLAGIPLRYHYFLYLHLGSINQLTGLSFFQGVFRLYLPPLLVLVPLQFAYAARVLGSTAGAGIVGAALFFLLSSFGPGLSVPNLFFPDQSQVLYATVFFLPAATLLAHAFQQRQAWLGWRRLALLLGLLVAAVGAKATTIPVLLGGLGLLAVYALVADRGLLRRLVVPAAAAGGVLIAALLTIYRDSGDTVQTLDAFIRVRSEQPFNWIATEVPNILHVHALLWLVAVIFATLKVTSGLWLGLWGVWTARGSGADRSRLWFLALLLAGIVIFFSAEQGGGSEAYFYVFAHEAGCALAGIGLAILWQRYVRPIPIRTPVLATVAVIALLVWGVSKPYDTSPHNFWLSLSGQIDDPGYALAPSCANRDMSPALYRGLRWLAAHSRTDAVLAVSNQYQARLSPQGGCKTEGRYFYYSAFAERRVLLEGYYKNGGGTPYPPKSVAERNPGATPYPDRFRLNDAIFQRGDASALDEAKRRYGIRYLVADALHGLTPAQIARVRRLGRTVFADSDVTIVAV